MNTESTLDALTTAIQITLSSMDTTLVLQTTKATLSRGYGLETVRSRSVPYGRYQVHVVATRDKMTGLAVFNDYGVKNKGSSSSRDSISLLNVDNLAAEIAQFLQTGVRG